MPLPPPAPRQPIHARRITCSGYRREDGLWDIEGHLTDVKSYAFPNRTRGEVVAGDPVHEMWIRLTVDDGLVIRDVVAETDLGPFGTCGAITPNYRRLIGERIGPGWRGKVRKLVPTIEGCTHQTELLGTMATAAFQAVYPALYKEKKRRVGWDGKDAEGRPVKPALIDSCHIYRSDGEVVARNWPAWSTRDSAGEPPSDI